MSAALLPLRDIALVAIVTVAFTSEATIGFGATLITVSVGSLLAPMDDLLYSFVPLNIALSLVVATRARHYIDRRLLVSRILPAMALGMVPGILAFATLPRSKLQLAFGAFVVVLGALELRRQLGDDDAERPLRRSIALGLLFLGGVVHGAFASGGPAVVYVCGRTIADKRVFRATLATLWLVLNLVLVAVYAHGGHIGAASLRTSAMLAPGLVIGLLAGEAAHGRIPERGFRVAVFAMLVVVGVVLAIRA